jgi:hypothetical protein
MNTMAEAIWLAARASSWGVKVKTDDPRRARALLLRERESLGDESLHEISLFVVDGEGFNIVLVKRGLPG